MRNRDRRRANERRRMLAEAAQTPLHMRGLHYHPGSPQPVMGQLDRAEAKSRAYRARYPVAPVYVTKIGTGAAR